MTQREPASVVGILAYKHATSDSGSHMPVWMIIVGVIAGVLGVVIMMVASGHKKEAKVANDYAVALSGGQFNESSAIDTAVTFGHVGLGVLIAGGALALAGLVVIAARR
jgi:hypothetical protein